MVRDRMLGDGARHAFSVTGARPDTPIIELYRRVDMARTLLFLASALLACNGSTGGTPPPPGTEAGPPGGDGAAGDRGGTVGCKPPCVAPKVCSAGVCVDPGKCASDKDCAPPLVCDPAKRECVAPKDCGNQQLQAGVVPPNVLLVLDRSCSMTDKVAQLTKWQIAVAALDKLLAGYADAIRFGLILFPDITGKPCTQDQIPFPVGAGNAPKIQALLKAALAKTDPYYPDGPCVTNIDTAMQQAATDPGLADPARSSFIVLLTDGKQAGCNDGGGDAGTTKTIQDLLAKKVPTFVIGFGAAVDPAQLDIFAAAGGRPSGDPSHKFYKAEDQTSLDAALAGIAGKAFGCVLKLTQLPPDAGKLFVFFDGKSVARDPSHKQGWDYDAASNQITFYGTACSDLTDGKVKKLDIIYGCKGGGDGGPSIQLDGGSASCPPDIVKCTTQADCPQKTKCLAGCCAKIIE
jgi:hypothetical protein